MSLIFLRRQLKIQDNSSTNNRALLNNLFAQQQKSKYSPGWVYNTYFTKALFFCKDDLIIIAKKYNYLSKWIDFKLVELKRDSRWIERKYVRVKPDLRDNDNYDEYKKEYNYECGSMRLIKPTNNHIISIGNLLAYKHLLNEQGIFNLNVICDFILINSKISYQHIKWLNKVNKRLISI